MSYNENTFKCHRIKPNIYESISLDKVMKMDQLTHKKYKYLLYLSFIAIKEALFVPS